MSHRSSQSLGFLLWKDFYRWLCWLSISFLVNFGKLYFSRNFSIYNAHFQSYWHRFSFSISSIFLTFVFSFLIICASSLSKIYVYILFPYSIFPGVSCLFVCLFFSVSLFQRTNFWLSRSSLLYLLCLCEMISSLLLGDCCFISILLFYFYLPMFEA